MIGEKYLGTKIEGNKVIRTCEFKQFDYDYEEIAIYFSDHICCDPEDLFYKGIYEGYEEFDSLDADRVLEEVLELIDEWTKENEEGEENDIKTIKSFVKPLKEAEGFTISFNKKIEDYKNRVIK